MQNCNYLDRFWHKNPPDISIRRAVLKRFRLGAGVPDHGEFLLFCAFDTAQIGIDLTVRNIGVFKGQGDIGFP